MRHAPSMGSHVIRSQPAHIAHLLKLETHFLAGVGACVLPSTMLCGLVGLKLGIGSLAACFARLSTALLYRMSARSFWSTACCSSRSLGIHLRTSLTATTSTHSHKRGRVAIFSRSSVQALSVRTQVKNHNATPSTLGVLYFLSVVEGQGAHPQASGVRKQVWVCSAIPQCDGHFWGGNPAAQKFLGEIPQLFYILCFG